jgi:hypothetical protein
MTSIAIYGEAQGVDLPLSMHAMATERRYNAWLPARRDVSEVATCARLYSAFAKAGSHKVMQREKRCGRTHTVKGDMLGPNRRDRADPTIVPR